MPKEIIRAGQLEINFLLEGKDTNGQVAMFDMIVPFGGKPPLPHYHESYDETLYGLEGVITLKVDDKSIEIAPGESYFIPRGVVHGFDNLGKINAKVLSVVTPALIGPDYFREIAAIINAGGPPDIGKIKEIMNRHGLVPVMPKV